MDEKLMLCPGCGGEAEVIGHFMKGVANRFHYFVRCKECKHGPHNEFKKKEKAIQSWNNQRKENTKMDYKSVLEEQIRELQKVQDATVKNFVPESACKVAETILSLIRTANAM